MDGVVILEPFGQALQHGNGVWPWVYADVVALEGFDEGLADAVAFGAANWLVASVGCASPGQNLRDASDAASTRKMAINPKTTARKVLNMPHVMVDEVERYRSTTNIKTHSAALRRLIQSGLATYDRCRIIQPVSLASSGSRLLRQATPLSALQCRLARAAAQIRVTELARSANLAPKTLVDFEAGKRVPHRRTAMAIRRALEAVGVEFTVDQRGAGVRLRSAETP